jgi:hypothetical protein
MFILEVIGILIIIFILVTLCILLIPFRLHIEIKWNGPLVRTWYKLAWIGLPLRERGFSGSACEIIRWRGDEEKATEGEREGRENEPTRLSDLGTLLKAAPSLARAFGELSRAVQMEKFFCHLRWGSSDPADTAFYSGCLWPVVAALSSWGFHLYFQPCFEEEALDGSLFTELKASLIWVILPLLKVLRKEKAMRLLVQNAWRR